MFARRLQRAVSGSLAFFLGAGTAAGELGDPSPPARAAPAGGPVAAPASTLSSEGESAASAAPRKVTVIASEQHPSLPLLRAELEALGLEVLELSPETPVVDSEFRVVLGEGHIEVWIFDRATGRVTMREVFSQADGTPLESLTGVLHAVELLRWHLQPTPPDRARPLAVAETPSPPPRKRSGLSLAAVSQGVYSPGGTSIGAGAELDVTKTWSAIGVRLFGSTTLLPNRIETSEGAAEATPRLVGVQGVMAARRGATPFVGALGGGVALVSTRLQAIAEPGYRAVDDHLLTVAPIVDVRAGPALGRHVSLLACASAAFPLRSDSLRFADRQVARHGQVLLTWGLALELTLP